MLIEYNVSQDGLVIKTFPKGLLNTKEIINYFERLNNDESINQGSTEIVYFKHVTNFKISLSESQLITVRYQDTKAKRMIYRTIFVCETNLAYGIGRMLQIFHEITNPDHKVVVVRSESEIVDIKGKN